MQIVREYLKELLQETIEEAQKSKKNFALLFCDLDNFKQINNTLGHDIGDLVLSKTKEKIKALVGGNVVCRIGGDEFAIILKDTHSYKDIKGNAQQIIYSMRNAIQIEKNTLFVPISIGIALYDKDAKTVKELIQCADIALYKAKNKGRDNCQFYELSTMKKLQEKSLIEKELHKAITHEELKVFFQPQYDTRTQHIVGMEALVRWEHPLKGMIFPDKFIPIAEKSDLIIKLDDYVMQKAMEQFLQWHKDGLNPGTLSLNLAMRQLTEGDFPKKLHKIMKKLHFTPSLLELEMLEREVMEDPETSIEKLHKLLFMGVGIAIDDFGTGYSSLAYLKKLPLTKLKIDRAFIKDIPFNEDDMAISRAIIALAQSLDLKIVAEGIEEKEQVKFLKENNCFVVQGYLFSKPLSIENMTQLLQECAEKSKNTLKDFLLEDNSVHEYARKVSLNNTSYAHQEIAVKSTDGNMIWLKEKNIPLVDDNNDIISNIVIRYDVTHEKSLEKLATTDALTLLSNRRSFDTIISREIAQANRENKSLSFVMIDIDNFKKYNDSYGHKAGDTVLYRVATALKTHLKRGSDFCFRLGGEEFGILFHTKDVQKALEYAEKIVQNVENMNLEHVASDVCNHITISAGLLVINFAEEYIDEQGFYTMADDALYQAKEQGKNRVVLYENEGIDFFG